jgi:hypothetical protein
MAWRTRCDLAGIVGVLDRTDKFSGRHLENREHLGLQAASILFNQTSDAERTPAMMHQICLRPCHLRAERHALSSLVSRSLLLCGAARLACREIDSATWQAFD